MFIEDKAIGEPSLDGFIDFCSSKDPNEKYHWTNANECACGQYLKAIGQFSPNWVDSGVFLMTILNCIAGGTVNIDSDIFTEQDWTFGKCAERAKKVKELV